MNWKLILIPIALPVELISGLITGFECGFGNWVMDRKLGDPNGKWHQTREQALEDSRKSK